MDAAVWSLVLWFVLGYAASVVLWVCTVGFFAYAGSLDKPAVAFTALTVGIIATLAALSLTTVNVILSVVKIVELVVNGN